MVSGNEYIVNIQQDTLLSDLTDEAMHLKEHKINVAIKLNDTFDKLLDNEVALFSKSKTTPAKHISSFFTGIYFLTVAKFTNPLAYKIAWRLVDKLKTEEFEAKH